MTVEKTVLHIEDNFDNRMLVRRLLQAYGYSVIEAENAAQATENATSSAARPDPDGY